MTEKEQADFIKVNIDPNVDHLISKDHDKYLTSQVDGLTPKFMGINRADGAILMSLYYEFYRKGLSQNHTLTDAVTSSLLFSDHINEISQCVKKCKLSFTPTEENTKNEAQVVFDLQKRSHHIYAQNFGYFQDQNEFTVGYQLEDTFYPRRIQRMELFDKLTAGWQSRYHKQQMQYFIS